MSNAANAIIAKQMLTVLKNIADQLKIITETNTVVFQTVAIDQEKITPENLQRMNSTLIDMYVQLNEGIKVEHTQQNTFLPGWLPPMNPHVNYREKSDFHYRYDPFFNNNQKSETIPFNLSEKDKELLKVVDSFERLIPNEGKKYGDLYSSLKICESRTLVDGKKYGLYFQDTNDLPLPVYTTCCINIDRNMVNLLKMYPITRLFIKEL